MKPLRGIVPLALGLLCQAALASADERVQSVFDALALSVVAGELEPGLGVAS